MTHKILEEILKELPLVQQVQWVAKLQNEIQDVLPKNIASFIRCSMENNKIVILVENGAIARRILDYLDYIQVVLDKYRLPIPRILVIPKNK